MKQFALTLSGKPIRLFSSPCQALIYVIDVLIKLSLLTVIISMGLFSDVFTSRYDQLGVYIGMYIFTIWVWGLLLVKYIMKKGNVVGKTRFDLFLIGMLFFSLVSVLLSDYKSSGVFGSNGMWSLNILTLMSISLIFYAAYSTLNYARGVKWIALGLVLSIIIPGSRYIYLILDENPSRNIEFLNYVVLNIPLVISLLFLFKRFALKMAALVALLTSLFLISYNADYVQEGMFFLGIGVLSLFVLFYFAFWIRNWGAIGTVFSKVLRSRFNITKVRDAIKQEKSFRKVFSIVLFVAVWIIVFASILLNYFNETYPYFFDWVDKDLSWMEGIGMWVFGKNNLSFNIGSFEITSMLINYGLAVSAFLVGMLGFLVYRLGNYTIKFVYRASWTNIIFISSVFVTAVTVSAYYLLSRVTPYLQIELSFLLVLAAIIGAILRRETKTKIGECRTEGLLSKTPVRIVAILVVLAITIFMMNGLMQGFSEGMFIDIS